MVKGGDVIPEELRHPRQALRRAVRSAEAAAAVSELDRRLTRYRRDRKLGAGTFRGMHVVVHRGYVVGEEVRVHLRVIEEPVMPEVGQDLPMVESAKQNLRRFLALGMPQVRVVVRTGDAEAEAVTGRRGYASTTLAAPGLEPGWHPVLATVPAEDPDQQEVIGSGRVVVPASGAPFAVVSDIDDTVLRTGLTEGMTALLNTLLGDANSRAAVPGMASLYRGVARGARPAGRSSASSAESSTAPTFFYVSTGSWAMYPVLTKFLQSRGFPRGPLFLTDWGPTDRYILRSGVEHKRNAIGRLLAAYPDTAFVLIGDSGQGDPDVYLEFAGSHPNQVAAIIIVDVGPHLADRADELTARALEAQANDVQFHFVRDAYQAAEVAVDLGLCDEATLEEVETELIAAG
jgi:phosphatidate phosphatase APP1